jgi:hypothetical protein
MTDFEDLKNMARDREFCVVVGADKMKLSPCTRRFRTDGEIDPTKVYDTFQKTLDDFESIEDVKINEREKLALEYTVELPRGTKKVYCDILGR